MSEPLYEYKKVRVQDGVAVEAQNYANQGWRTVSVFREKPVMLGHVAKFEVLHLLLERPKEVEGHRLFFTAETMENLKKFNEWAAIDRSEEDQSSEG